ncbi:tagaturonate reductase [Puia dinghuensis]|uniref:Altronate oxidoreductase n=1 Tax=Puia dinghuensis TaxID=1792502 RepID=A0A8J2UIK7_9BACT|nr:tagaturonate reductase [Puia dinghuensis]GGB21316.1 altronate oxidoreductase [Puia dinghuensis]
MNLSKETLKQVTARGITKPADAIFSLPEKVLQFGTGVLLRGLPDYFIDKANRQGLFNGRVVVVKSTDSGDSGAFDRQDGLYTLCVRGIEEGKKVEENIICSAISRVLSARDQWQDILRLAHNPEMQIIISNTTEVGIQLVEDNIHHVPPVSFPGKLLAFLYERYKAFNGSPDSGMVIVPTELIVDNGKKLAGIVKELALMGQLETAFLGWMEQHCRFCSSLVDRIVPGKPDAATLQQLQHDLGYTDDLLSISEVYRLWAIEGDEKVRKTLSFAAADPGVIIEPDIEVYRELKLRLLNGTHTLSCGLAYLSGFNTVKNAMDDTAFSTFVQDLMLKEIAPAIPYTLPLEDARDFGLKVLDRFRNPHLQHQWISITMQYTSKMKSRDIPVLLRHYEQHDTPPPHFVLGFAAYILFMRGGQPPHPVNDDKAGYFADLWKQYPAPEVATLVLKDKSLWGADLSQLPGFEGAVRLSLDDLINKGPAATLAKLTTQKSTI